MSVPAAYLGVIVIWSSTPLAIQWSSEGPGFLFGVAARMVIGLAILLMVIRLGRLEFPWDRESRRVYLVGGLTLYVTMTAVYWSAQYIPSGWIAVVFGLSPIITGLFALRLLEEASFSRGRLTGMLLGVTGLGLVFLEGIEVRTAAWLGVMGATVAATVHSGGAVVLKALRPQMPALSVTAGGLMVATPLFVLAAALGQGWPAQIPQRAYAAIVYLGLFGSALGFPLYFYILKRITAGRVALITLITPVLALLLGAVVNGEVISAQVWLGTSFIVAGLLFYEFGSLVLGQPQTRA